MRLLILAQLQKLLSCLTAWQHAFRLFLQAKQLDILLAAQSLLLHLPLISGCNLQMCNAQPQKMVLQPAELTSQAWADDKGLKLGRAGAGTAMKKHAL